VDFAVTQPFEQLALYWRLMMCVFARAPARERVIAALASLAAICRIPSVLAARASLHLASGVLHWWCGSGRSRLKYRQALSPTDIRVISWANSKYELVD